MGIIDEVRDEIIETLGLMDRVGEMLLKNAGNPSNPRRKSNGSPTCDEDENSSDMMYQGLRKIDPSCSILDEERFEKGHDGRGEGRLVKVVDSLDSTKYYMGVNNQCEPDPRYRGDDWSIIVGWMLDFVPIAGAVLKPAKEEVAWGIHYNGYSKTSYRKGSEAWRPIQVIKKSRDIELVVSRGRGGTELDTLIDRLDPHSIIRMSGSARPLEIAKGNANLVLMPPSSITHIWDLAGVVPIVKAAGGDMSDVYGASHDYRASDCVNLGGVIATNGVLHPKALGLYQPRLDLT